ncbi:Rhodanese domain protein [Methanocaldococcus villosus KIN24-T80]|uniref:Rhodanese domain protein n=1 Tax=Methanocaldococcus villosus KIN24-T80 TaxID=1069083 RepID=N6VR40_9EURY|nr:selenouridine synthase SelU-like subunit [Methanocaldococcus villosus]ENN95586.1 Rhodanese domain protein [Methanocaldococcus villosus KIN24-T80]
MDEDILARLITFDKDVVLAIVLDSGKKMITDGEKILAGKIGGDLASFIIKEAKHIKSPTVKEFNNHKIYFEKINIDKFLGSLDKSFLRDVINVSELMTLKNYILVDVRSPREFKEGTIEGAINIPLFLDDEHELIGKTYKEMGKDKAIDLAINIVEKGLKRILNEAKKLDRDKTIVVFCARGGLRSQVMALIFKLLGFKVKRLLGGYKAYKLSSIKKLS